MYVWYPLMCWTISAKEINFVNYQKYEIELLFICGAGIGDLYSSCLGPSLTLLKP